MLLNHLSEYSPNDYYLIGRSNNRTIPAHLNRWTHNYVLNIVEISAAMSKLLVLKTIRCYSPRKFYAGQVPDPPYYNFR